MGKKSVLTKEYQEFLNRVKANRSAKADKNFFSYENVIALSNALDAEIKQTKEKLQKFKDTLDKKRGDIVESAANTGTKVRDFFGKNFAQLQSYVSEDTTIDPRKVDLETLKALRRNLKNGKEYTPFLRFAEKSKESINQYLNFVEHYNFPLNRFYERLDSFYSDLLAALKEYRKTAKSHYYLKSSIGRAEIANKMMGASLERWLHHSKLALYKVGTEFSINENFKYVCRKATPEEEAESDDNKGRPKFLRYKHVITEIVPKTK